MYSKGSNLVSIFVATVSIGLIILAVFLLNQTFSNKPGMASTTSSSAASLLNISKTTKYESAPASQQNSSSQTAIQGVSYSLGVSSASSSILASAGNSVSSVSANSASASSAASLATGQLVVKYIGNQPKGNFEIVSCNIPNPKRCKAGFQFAYSELVGAEAGKVVNFNNCMINDADETFEISDCKIS